MVRRAALVAVVVLACACSRRHEPSIRPAPERTVASAPIAPRPSASFPLPANFVSGLIGHAGEEVTVIGRFAPPGTHLVRTLPGKRIAYVDLQGSPTQIAVYFDTLPVCPGDVLLEGKVFVAVGKLPKTGADFAEPQLDVARVDCR
jgi:hypothetical protein